MYFADIHCHILAGMDDGPQTPAEMFALADAVCQDGTRLLCLTPHYPSGCYSTAAGQAAEMYRLLADWAAQHCPDLVLLPGNELHCIPGCLSWLTDGTCRTLGNTRYVLTDFAAEAGAEEITTGLHRLLSGGFLPILAHAERYPALRLSHLISLKQSGVLLQLNASSLISRRHLLQYHRTHAILQADLADFVASDAHDIIRRPPCMKAAYTVLAKKYGIARADALCRKNAIHLLCTEPERNAPWKETKP